MMIGCFEGFSSSSVLKYGLQADRTILWALHVCPSQANVTLKKKQFTVLVLLNLAMTATYIGKALLITQVFERRNHVVLEVVPF